MFGQDTFVLVGVQASFEKQLAIANSLEKGLWSCYWPKTIKLSGYNLTTDNAFTRLDMNFIIIYRIIEKNTPLAKQVTA